MAEARLNGEHAQLLAGGMMSPLMSIVYAIPPQW